MDTYINHTDTLSESHVKIAGSNWFNHLTRFEYKKHYSSIENTRQLKALLREGQYAFPGGYAVIAFTSGGAALCNDCIKDNLSSVLWSIRHNVSDGWKVCWVDLYYGVEDNGNVCCDNCGKSWENI